MENELIWCFFDRAICISICIAPNLFHLQITNYRCGFLFYTDAYWNIWHDLMALLCGGARDYSYFTGTGYSFLTEAGLDHFQFLTKQ